MTETTTTTEVLLCGYRNNLMRRGLVKGTVVLVNDKAKLTYINQTYDELVWTRDALAEVATVRSNCQAGKALKLLARQIPNFDQWVANQQAGRAARAAARAS